MFTVTRKSSSLASIVLDAVTVGNILCGIAPSFESITTTSSFVLEDNSSPLMSITETGISTFLLSSPSTKLKEPKIDWAPEVPSAAESFVFQRDRFVGRDGIPNE